MTMPATMPETFVLAEARRLAGIPPDRTVVYMSHPLAGNFQANIHNANLWYRFLRKLSPAGITKLLGTQRTEDQEPAFERKGVTLLKESTAVGELNPPKEKEPRYVLAKPFARPPVIMAPWLCCPVPDHEYPGGRDKAISDCLATARLADELWHVGGRITDGMKGEGGVAKMVRDLTHWGFHPPIWEETQLFI